MLGRSDCIFTEYEQCAGTMETAGRSPRGHRGRLCDVRLRCDIISQGVMELHTHEVSKKTEGGKNVHFPYLKEELNEDSVVTRGQIQMLPGQRMCVVSADAKVGNFPAGTFM